MADILGEWNLIETDFQEVYGLDISDPAIRTGRSWRWFLVRLAGLMITECRVQRRFNPIKPEKHK